MSQAFRPCAANGEIRILRLAVGGGRLVLAVVWLAVLASLLPNGIAHDRPPDCMIFIIDHFLHG